MKKLRAENAAAIIVNVLIIVFTVNAISYNFRDDIIWEVTYLDFKRWKCLRYFTNLSNIYAAVAACVVLVFNFKNAVKDEFSLPKSVIYLKFSATAAVAVTFLTVVLFLGPTVAASGNGYFTLFKQNNFFLHFLVPVLSILSFVFLDRGEKTPLKSTIFGLLPTVAYSVVYVVMVVFIGGENGWPDFYGFTFGGRMWAVPLSVIGMYAATFGISAGLRALRNVFFAKAE
ncbi:MAG: hypothetical protein IJR61_05790 [Clostridia bacterium]|nr:hypothetical protein [Clostridia bacterium]